MGKRSYGTGQLFAHCDSGGRELRRRIETDVVIAGAQRRSVAEAGEAYIEHLEFLIERKRTTSPTTADI